MTAPGFNLGYQQVPNVRRFDGVESRPGALLKASLRSLGLALLCATTLSVHAVAPLNFDSAAQRTRFQQLITEIRCLVCQNQSLADSPAPLANKLRQEVLQLMQSGKTDDEIRAYLVQRYGEFVLYDPPVEPSTWALWFGPVLLLALGAAGLWVALKRRRSSSEDSGGDPI